MSFPKNYIVCKWKQFIKQSWTKNLTIDGKINDLTQLDKIETNFYLGIDFCLATTVKLNLLPNVLKSSKLKIKHTN